MGQEWLNASTGMPGVLELELGRPVLKKEKKGKKKKKEIAKQISCPKK